VEAVAADNNNFANDVIMKTLNYIILIIGIQFISTPLCSQTLYDANRYMDTELNGTARFVGMGGAMGALGGDISTTGTNPAGIGIYRSNDAMLSFDFTGVGTKTQLNGTQTDKDGIFSSFDNIGFVLAIKQGDVTPLRFVNFGFNYSRKKSLDKNLLVNGKLNGNISQTDQMAAMSNGIIKFGDHPYEDNNIGWLSVMGWNTWLTFVDQTITTTVPNENPYLDAERNQIVDDKGNPLYIQTVLFGGFGTNPMTEYSARERGGVNDFDFNLAFNLHDRFYIGATLGFSDVDYSRNSIYRESSDEGRYSLENWFDTKGLGVNFKVGTIVRVTDHFRIGAAIHVPTLYRLTDYHGARLISDIKGETHEEDTYKQAAEVKTEYSLATPWKFNASLGYTIGKNVALGAEYEYQDRSAAKLKYDDGVHMSHENQMIKNGLKSVHTFRLGAEFRVAPRLSLRAGYNYITSPMYADTFKNLPINTVRTDTEFSNIKALSNYTLGLGYRGSQYYADIAYKYQTNKENFYAFDHTDLPATKVNNNTHQVLMTLGLRF
jgi:hypothetical protein